MASAGSRPSKRAISLWRRPLLVGLCFGLGYGVTQRLLDLRLPGFVQWGQSFDVRQMPGTGIDSRRLGLGSDAQDLRGRLDLLELKPEAPVAPQKAAETPAETPPEVQVPEAGDHQDQPAPQAPTLPPPTPQP